VGPLSIGAKVGIPLLDAFEFSSPGTCDSNAKPVCSILNYSSKTKRYTFGPTIEWRLTHGFGIEVDAHYNRLNYDSYFFSRTPSSGQLSAFTSTRADRWNFPILLKWRHDVHRLSPFVNGGIAFDHISGVRSNFTGGTTSNVDELTNTNTEGFVAGGGIEFRPVRHLRLMPEVRYTRWFSENFDREPGPVFRTNLNETTYLLGIAF
jgi:opacity protein-like surface antigen